MSENSYIVPSNHRGFRAKSVMSVRNGDPLDIAEAEMESGGGGPDPCHTHDHDHVFYVIEGEAAIVMNGEETLVKAGEAIHVPGATVHSVWNRSQRPARVLGVTV